MPTHNLKAFNHGELEAFALDNGLPRYRARQLYRWIHARGAVDLGAMTDIPASIRSKLGAVAAVGCLVELRRIESSDGTAKFLFGLDDGNAVESVCLAHDYGTSACVSSQVGCAMGCRFCASAIGGMVRNLAAWEMEDQVICIARAKGVRVSSVVVMGSGEPMENLTAVCEFIDRVTDPRGLAIGQRHITVSTCGLPGPMLEFGRVHPQVTLAVSLHAPTDDLRSALMPVNRRFPLQVLMAACRDYVAIAGRRISFEYALAAGLNDSSDHADELASLLRGLLCHVNLIPLNAVSTRDLSAPSRQVVADFASRLKGLGIPVSVRRELGSDIDAACGQLRRRVIGIDDTGPLKEG